MLEGALVVIVGALDKRIKERENQGLVIGTFIGKLSDKRVSVILSDGEIFVGEEYTIVSYEEQQ